MDSVSRKHSLLNNCTSWTRIWGSESSNH